MSYISNQNRNKNMEPLEDDSNSRYSMFPIVYHDIYDMYKKALDSVWTAHEIKESIDSDVKGYKQLDDGAKLFLRTVVAFFAISDGVVNEVLEEELESRIKVRELKVWYNSQKFMEDIHNETYALLIETYIESPEERKNIFESIKNFPVIKRKIDWLHKWVSSENPFRHIDSEIQKSLKIIAKTFQNSLNDFLHNINYDTDLDSPVAPIQKFDSVINSIVNSKQAPLGQVILANVIMEGVFFSSSFASIFWINHYYKGQLPGLAKANQLISRDEGMHVDLAILVYRKYIKNKLDEKIVRTMFKEAIDVENDFIDTCLPANLRGMNADMMKQYVRFVADQLLLDLGYSIIFGDKNPFEFMQKQSISVRVGDFFTDTNTAEYKLPVNNGLKFDDNF